MKKFVITSLSVLCVFAVFANISVAKDMKFFHDNPEWQQNWSDMGALSEKTIGLKMIPTEFDTQVYKSRIKVDLTASRAPSAFKWWFGYRAQELLQAGLLADLSDVWDEVGDNFAPGVREALTQDGVAYGFPLHVSYWVWYYTLYEKLGLELPTTWNGFMEQLALLKEKGISGIGNTIGQSRWT